MICWVKCLEAYSALTKFVVIKEQPLLLEDLLEQEKREQEKLQNQPPSQEVTSSTSVEPEPALLSDHDFERLKADVFNSGPVGINSPVSQSSGPIPSQPSWQQNQVRPPPTPTPQVTTEITTRVQIFNANLMPAPPLPPENIVTEQDKQSQLLYEQWLNHQNNVLTQQLRYYETEVQKLRKSRKVRIFDMHRFGCNCIFFFSRWIANSGSWENLAISWRKQMLRNYSVFPLTKQSSRNTWSQAGSRAGNTACWYRYLLTLIGTALLCRSSTISILVVEKIYTFCRIFQQSI